VELPLSPVGGLRLKADLTKRDKIKEAFEWSWSAYEKHAFGDDEVRRRGLSNASCWLIVQLNPLSQSGSNLTSAGGIGYTIVDSLDSLLVMGFLDEYRRARKWCEGLSFDRDAEFNTFEVRYGNGIDFSK